MEKVMKIEDMIPVIEEVIKSGGDFRMMTAGTSMMPLLRDRKDVVILTKAQLPLRKYDIPLYKRTDGTFIIHRVVDVKNDCYVMCGDNQYIFEYGITDTQIYAVVKGIVRKGKYIYLDSKRYRLYVFLCTHTRSLRHFIIRVKNKIIRTVKKW